jgi:malate dehydrogenase (quinone)
MDDKGKVQIAKAVEINENFQISRQFWSHQVRKGVLGNPREFINSTPHMNLVFGAENREFIRKRVEALKASPLFAGMEMSTDPAQIKVDSHHDGRPQAGRGRDGHALAAGHRRQPRRHHPPVLPAPQRARRRQDFDGHEVRSITRNADGSWRVSAFDIKDKSRIQTVDARHIFIGAGGALPLLQLSGIPEAKQYGGFPVGGEFLVTDNPQIASRHLAKVYGLADTGSPPMSVPHLDTRVLDGKTVLLFGPFATWSSKYLKNGSYFDMAKATTPSNVIPQLQVGMHEFALVKYLAQQLELSKEEKMAALRRYMPEAKDEDWRLWQAGQRVQIIKNVPGQGGVLKLGTEVVVSEDRSVSALLGASPGGSTSPAIMLSLLEKVFPDQMKSAAWRSKILEIVPSYGKNSMRIRHCWRQNGQALLKPCNWRLPRLAWKDSRRPPLRPTSREW